MFKFRLLHGIHVCKVNGRPVVHREGDVFDSEADLRAHNGAGMSPKFLFIGDSRAPSLPPGATVCPTCHQSLTQPTPAQVAASAPPAPSTMAPDPAKLLGDEPALSETEVPLSKPHETKRLESPDPIAARLMNLSDEELKHVAEDEEVEIEPFDSRELIIAKIETVLMDRQTPVKEPS